MLALFNKENRTKVDRLLSIMLPTIGTQMAIIGMNFFDASMSGQAGNVDLAGAAIGGNIWMPIQTGFGGVLMAAMPLVANLLGAGEKDKIPVVVKHGLFLATIFALLILTAGFIFLPTFLGSMGLEPAVYDVALWYLAGLGLGVFPFFLITPLRSMVDTFGYTKLSMKIYMLALPINAFLNYILIFGKFGFPRLGGVGAGVATGVTYWLLFFMFAFFVVRYQPFNEYKVLGLVKPIGSWLKEYLRIGIPMGVSIFMETSIFGVVAIFVAKFGTDVIAGHQAALNFSSLIYMFPMSFSLALTIVVGVEYGAKRFEDAMTYTKIGLQLSTILSFIYMILEYFNQDLIASIYTTDPDVIVLIKHFIIYAILWQLGDAIGCPIQGSLRGYKEVNSIFWASMLAFWGITLPLGLYLDYYCNQGAYSYWQSLVVGVGISAVILSYWLHRLQKKLK